MSSHGNDLVSDVSREKADGWVKVADVVAGDYELHNVFDRLARFRKVLADKKCNYFELYQELKSLKDAVDDGLKNQLIYRYPTEKAKVLWSRKIDWEPVIKTFPDAEQDIFAGVDLWALGHSTASVFHLMRVLEHGLLALATNLEIEHSIENWQTIIGRIESEITKRQKSLTRGKGRNIR